jgi:hypothetical protein
MFVVAFAGLMGVQRAIAIRRAPRVVAATAQSHRAAEA